MKSAFDITTAGLLAFLLYSGFILQIAESFRFDNNVVDPGKIASLIADAAVYSEAGARLKYDHLSRAALAKLHESIDISTSSRAGDMKDHDWETTPEMYAQHEMPDKAMEKEQEMRTWKKQLESLIGGGQENRKCGHNYTKTTSFSLAIDESKRVDMGENSDESDERGGYQFFRDVIGFTEDEIQESAYLAMKHFHMQFGLVFDVPNAHYDHMTVSWRMPSEKLNLKPFVDVHKYRLTMYSEMPINCADGTGVSGGWVTKLKGPVTLYGNYGGEKGVKFGPGTEIALVNEYIVTLPTTRMSTRMALYPHTPCVMKDNGKFPLLNPFSAEIYNFDDQISGRIDGLTVLNYYKDGPDTKVMSYIYRGLVTFESESEERGGGGYYEHNDEKDEDEEDDMYEKEKPMGEDRKSKNDDNKRFEEPEVMVNIVNGPMTGAEDSNM